MAQVRMTSKLFYRSAQKEKIGYAIRCSGGPILGTMTFEGGSEENDVEVSDPVFSKDSHTILVTSRTLLGELFLISVATEDLAT